MLQIGAGDHFGSKRVADGWQTRSMITEPECRLLAWGLMDVPILSNWKGVTFFLELALHSWR